MTSSGTSHQDENARAPAKRSSDLHALWKEARKNLADPEADIDALRLSGELLETCRNHVTGAEALHGIEHDLGLVYKRLAFTVGEPFVELAVAALMSATEHGGVTLLSAQDPETFCTTIFALAGMAINSEVTEEILKQIERSVTKWIDKSPMRPLAAMRAEIFGALGGGYLNIALNGQSTQPRLHAALAAEYFSKATQEVNRLQVPGSDRPDLYVRHNRCLAVLASAGSIPTLRSAVDDAILLDAALIQQSHLGPPEDLGIQPADGVSVSVFTGTQRRKYLRSFRRNVIQVLRWKVAGDAFNESSMTAERLKLWRAWAPELLHHLEIMSESSGVSENLEHYFSDPATGSLMNWEIHAVKQAFVDEIVGQDDPLIELFERSSMHEILYGYPPGLMPVVLGTSVPPQYYDSHEDEDLPEAYEDPLAQLLHDDGGGVGTELVRLLIIIEQNAGSPVDFSADQLIRALQAVLASTIDEMQAMFVLSMTASFGYIRFAENAEWTLLVARLARQIAVSGVDLESDEAVRELMGAYEQCLRRRTLQPALLNEAIFWAELYAACAQKLLAAATDSISARASAARHVVYAATANSMCDLARASVSGDSLSRLSTALNLLEDPIFDEDDGEVRGRLLAEIEYVRALIVNADSESNLFAVATARFNTSVSSIELKLQKAYAVLDQAQHATPDQVENDKAVILAAAEYLAHSATLSSSDKFINEVIARGIVTIHALAAREILSVSIESLSHLRRLGISAAYRVSRELGVNTAGQTALVQPLMDTATRFAAVLELAQLRVQEGNCDAAIQLLSLYLRNTVTIAHATSSRWSKVLDALAARQLLLFALQNDISARTLQDAAWSAWQCSLGPYFEFAVSLADVVIGTAAMIEIEDDFHRVSVENMHADYRSLRVYESVRSGTGEANARLAVEGLYDIYRSDSSDAALFLSFLIAAINFIHRFQNPEIAYLLRDAVAQWRGS